MASIHALGERRPVLHQPIRIGELRLFGVLSLLAARGQPGRGDRRKRGHERESSSTCRYHREPLEANPFECGMAGRRRIRRAKNLLIGFPFCTSLPGNNILDSSFDRGRVPILIGERKRYRDGSIYFRRLVVH